MTAMMLSTRRTVKGTAIMSMVKGSPLGVNAADAKKTNTTD